MTGPTITTRTGRSVTPLDLQPNDIHPADIAHALSQKVRYTGHSRRLYTVGEHLVLGYRWLIRNSHPESLIRYWFLHDACEAYLPDVAKPLKPFIHGWNLIERKADLAVLTRFGLPEPDDATTRAVKWLDTYLLNEESTRLMPAPFNVPLPSAAKLNNDGVNKAWLDHYINTGTTPYETKRAMLTIFEQLFGSVAFREV